MRLGAHMSVAGGVANAVERAVVHGCEALQIFCKNASQWRGKPLDPEQTSARSGHASTRPASPRSSRTPAI